MADRKSYPLMLKRVRAIVVQGPDSTVEVRPGSVREEAFYSTDGVRREFLAAEAVLGGTPVLIKADAAIGFILEQEDS